jgi:hypothetical protein
MLDYLPARPQSFGLRKAGHMYTVINAEFHIAAHMSLYVSGEAMARS